MGRAKHGVAYTVRAIFRDNDLAVLLSAAAWLALYVVVVTAPLFVLLLGPVPQAGGFWWDFAMALGFAALSMMGVQFVLTARFRRAMTPFGIDIVYYFHRYLAVFALLAAAAHYLILRVDNPAALGALNPAVAPMHMTAGRASLAIFSLLVVSSLLRRQLGIEYDLWRWTHALGAVAGFVLALWHVIGTNHYVATPGKQVLWGLYGLLWIGVLVYVRAIRPWRLLRQPYRIDAVRSERGDAATLVLQPERSPALEFQPGQFVWLTLGSSPFALQEHPFSIASSAEGDTPIELTIKPVGDFSRAAVKVAPGTRAYLDGPYGTFTIDRRRGAAGYVFLAGGVGIAPIMSMLRTLADRGDRRPLLLIYGNRSWERVLFREELDALAQRLELRVVHVLKEPPEHWDGESGQFTQALLDRQLPAERGQLHYFICGPTAMTQSVEQWLAALRVPAAHIHSELFEWV